MTMKEWRDWFYFSSGERRALTFLTLLLIATWIALWITDKEAKQETEALMTEIDIPQDTIREATPLPEKPLPRKDFRQPEVPPKPKEARAFHKPFSSNQRKSISNKYPKGTIVELNGADSLTLRKIPGIGEAFSRRIVKYRDLLGGFYTVAQLAEVYGIDSDRYAVLAPWFRVDTTLIRPIHVNQADFRTLIRHPYLNKPQTTILLKLIKRKGKLNGWNDLRLLEEFTPEDQERLHHYLSFE